LAGRHLPDPPPLDGGIGGEILRIPFPSDGDPGTRALVERLVELTESLARRCSQLQEALDSRVIIEQAKGVLSERFRISPDEAFFILRAGARNNRARIHDLAADVVESRVTLPELAPFVDRPRKIGRRRAPAARIS
jgi:hypothetical protein